MPVGCLRLSGEIVRASLGLLGVLFLSLAERAIYQWLLLLEFTCTTPPTFFFLLQVMCLVGLDVIVVASLGRAYVELAISTLEVVQLLVSLLPRQRARAPTWKSRYTVMQSLARKSRVW